MNTKETDLKIIFMGTPDFAVTILEGLIENYKVDMVVTQPDKPKGRKLELKPTPVKELALKNNIQCLQPIKIKEIIEEIKNINPDLIITCAYGQILPQEMLEIPRLGCINVHASLLPKLRGGAPIHHAIIDGEEETGVTIMYMDQKMDAGDIISQEKVEIKEEDTTSILHDKLREIGRDLLIKTLPSIINETNSRTKQNEEEVTYGFTIKKEDEKIDFSKTSTEIVNQIRGLNSYPGAYCYLDDKRLKVWEAYKKENNKDKEIGEITQIYEDGFGVKVSDGEIVLKTVQIEGKGKTEAVSFANGHANLVGKVLK